MSLKEIETYTVFGKVMIRPEKLNNLKGLSKSQWNREGIQFLHKKQR